jgi:hypothetical protein
LPFHPLCFVSVLRVTNVVIRSRKPEDRKYNSQNKNHKGTHSDLQNTTLKTRDWATCPLLITAGELRYSGRVNSSCSTSATRRVTLVTNPSISHEWGKDRIVIMKNGTNPCSFVCEICKWHRYSVKVAVISMGHVAQSLVFSVVFCRSLCVPLWFLFWLLYFLSSGLRLLITSLVTRRTDTKQRGWKGKERSAKHYTEVQFPIICFCICFAIFIFNLFFFIFFHLIVWFCFVYFLLLYNHVEPYLCRIYMDVW